jgi:hypothetical protein
MCGYAFPPFNLILKVLRKLEDDQAEIVLITPQWPGQPWFPVVLRLAIADPVVLPHDVLIMPTDPEQEHPIAHLQLIAWRISAKGTDARDYRQGLQHLCYNLGAQRPRFNTRALGDDGIAGVCENTWIPYSLL